MFIIVRLGDLDNILKLQFHTEIGHIVGHLDVENTKSNDMYCFLSFGLIGTSTIPLLLYQMMIYF